MFSANAMSSLPISDDGKSSRTFRGSVKLFLNKATLAFPLYLNKIAEFSLSINLINSISLNRNAINNFSISINKIVNKNLNLNKLLNFIQRR